MYYYEWIVQNVPSVDVIKWSINFGKLLSTVFYTVDGQKYISAGMIELSTVFFLIFVKDNWVKIQRGHKINTKWYHTQEAECESDYRENQWGCSPSNSQLFTDTIIFVWQRGNDEKLSPPHCIMKHMYTLKIICKAADLLSSSSSKKADRPIV